ncbi:hypothetical protein AAG906_026012 [Vitis piasezkii]
MAAHLPSLQLVTEFGFEGRVKDMWLSGCLGGAIGASERPFLQTTHGIISLVADNASPDKRGHTLLTAQNLMAVVRESQEYVINILPRKLPKKVVPGQHYILKDLPFYKEVQKADAQKRRALLDDREGRRKEGTLRKAPGKKRPAPSPPAGAPAKKKKKVSNKGKEVKLPTPPKEVVIPPITYEKEVTIKEPENPLPPSISSGPGHLAGLNHSGPSLSAAGRLALLAEEATSINQPDSPHPDVDAVEASFVAALPPTASPLEEMGAESQSLPPCGPSPLALVPVKGPATRRSHPARNLKSGLIGRLEDRFLETIEVSCSSVQDDHPEVGREVKRIPLLERCHAFEKFVCLFAVVSAALETGGGEASLSTARGDNEALRADLAEAKSREESMDARLHEAEDEMAQLRGEVRQLRTEVSIEKKQREDLQLRLSTQKEELEGEFAAAREELEADYQKQVDEMYFFGYRCCMKKHGIKRDVPSIPPSEEKKLDKPAP